MINGTRMIRTVAVALLASVLAVAPMVVATAQVPIADADFSGYATGTVLHADAVQNATTRVADVELAYSGASVASKGLSSAISNEMQRIVQPAQPTKQTYGRGSGLEAGIVLTPPSTENSIIQAGKAEAAAAPSTDLITKEIGPVKVDPAVYASALRGQAQARWVPNQCILGSDLSYGLGYAADAQLIDQGANTQPGLDAPVVATDANNPTRAASQSVSHTKLVRQTKKNGDIAGFNFGLLSEVRETIAPVTLLAGTANQTTIEFLGEWVLRTHAGGLTDTAYVHYGPGSVSPQTPILRTINQAGTVTNNITFQQITGATGFTLDIPNVAEIAIGEDPRAIGGNAASQPAIAANGTSVSAAVDVARIKLLEQKDTSGNVTTRAADLRVGHMEAKSVVPVGGIACGLPVTKTANPTAVAVNQTFVTPITVTNPYDCDLTQVRVSDVVTTTSGAKFKVTAADPALSTPTLPTGDNLSGVTLVWNDIGPIASGASKTITATFLAQDAGRIDDVASVSAVLANCKGESAGLAGSAVSAAAAGVSGASNEVKVPVGAVQGVTLARTGASPAATLFVGLMLLGLAVLGVRFSRRTA